LDWKPYQRGFLKQEPYGTAVRCSTTVGLLFNLLEKQVREFPEAPAGSQFASFPQALGKIV
jgi:hypothetical protein